MRGPRLPLAALVLSAVFVLPAVFVLSGPGVFPARAAEADVLDFLREKNAALVSLAAEFTQETRIPLFDEPVVSTGRLLFKRPDALRWEYLSPLREGFAMRNGTGTRWRDDERNARPFAVGADPAGGFIARRFLPWLVFDPAAIEKEYAVAVKTPDPLTLSLVPKSADAAQVLEELVIVFAPEGVARSVTVRERQGGVTEIRFQSLRVNGPVADKEFP
ncbi:MAG: outer membrane lipoprotein carrier protein LolA [Deltaproteobacteria bacterium]|jgi:outer membrane lipoprotein-sorting protein|nr:outer membrane lipoprotein carrier protein LolA [Deltaproteobacteria bacterium]